MSILDSLHEPLDWEGPRVIGRIGSGSVVSLANSSEEGDPLRWMDNTNEFGMWLDDLVRMRDFGWYKSEITG